MCKKEVEREREGEEFPPFPLLEEIVIPPKMAISHIYIILSAHHAMLLGVVLRPLISPHNFVLRLALVCVCIRRPAVLAI